MNPSFKAPSAYKVISRAWPLAIGIGSVLSAKLRRRVHGYRDGWKSLVEFARQNNPKIAWFHCASLGEFEQARPLLEAFHSQHPDYKIAVSFFSPSGYEARKNYLLADWMDYLPYDTPAETARFLALLKPTLIFWVKYEFYPNILERVFAMGVSTYLVSAHIRPEHLEGQRGPWMKPLLSSFRYVFLQFPFSVPLLQQAGITNYKVVGDTRFDNVLAMTEGEAAPLPPLAQSIRTDDPLLLVGSAWQKDVEMLCKALKGYRLPYRLVIAPHEVKHARELGAIVYKHLNLTPVFYTQQEGEIPEYVRVVIVDTVGLLARLYRLCDVAWVGGGFAGALHNILEPASWGKPVIFGPETEKYPESIQLVEAGGAMRVIDIDSTRKALATLLQRHSEREAAGLNARRFVEAHAGATERILGFVEEEL